MELSYHQSPLLWPLVALLKEDRMGHKGKGVAKIQDELGLSLGRNWSQWLHFFALPKSQKQVSKEAKEDDSLGWR